ncbi:hypothetical protein [Tropicimonas sp. IMCC34011]|uniref:hypothetical protein n=1 Tax=Tropicimonas sp. IMCC34011 TaxID=2248759 RepID=UPI000E249503|nr:hypothetical protein [Tropicimonas sp. IMCC34011]
MSLALRLTAPIVAIAVLGACEPGKLDRILDPEAAAMAEAPPEQQLPKLVSSEAGVTRMRYPGGCEVRIGTEGIATGRTADCTQDQVARAIMEARLGTPEPA